MDYAIIELGGKQYRVEKGDSVVVDRLDAKEGAKVTPRALLLRSGDKTVLEGSELAKVKVEAVVAEHLRGEKVRVFKYRPKKRYRRSAGHRSALTRLEITGIRMATAAKAATGADEGSKPAAKRAAPAKKEEVAASAPAKKPAARKPAAKKPTSRKAE
jgi:large subunit ribosomal protein L21